MLPVSSSRDMTHVHQLLTGTTLHVEPYDSHDDLMQLQKGLGWSILLEVVIL